MRVLGTCVRARKAVILQRQTTLLFYTGIRAVNSHKTNIFNKLGLSSSVEMVRFALEHGII